MTIPPPPAWLLVAAGCGQIALALASLLIPRALGWRQQTALLRPLTRQVFWTWGGYICGSHLSFGLLSALAPHSLLDGGMLATAVCGFIALWWLVRLVLQFTCFDRTDAPSGMRYQLAEAALVLLFTAFTVVYGMALLSGLSG